MECAVLHCARCEVSFHLRSILANRNIWAFEKIEGTFTTLVELLSAVFEEEDYVDGADDDDHDAHADNDVNDDDDVDDDDDNDDNDVDDTHGDQNDKDVRNLRNTLGTALHRWGMWSLDPEYVKILRFELLDLIQNCLLMK